jgi:glycosyltransferase involved in cell wall biosynthesis
MTLKPKVSFIIPTLNAAEVLNACLKSIRYQNYPKNSIDIIIIDGGSTDNTLIIAKKYKAKIINNPLKTAEAGKAIGVKNASGQYIALIDSDNILPDKNWLNKMIHPLSKDNSLIGSEPWKFTYRKDGGFIERYSALLGANDPYTYTSGVYDRYNYLTSKWTGLNLNIVNYPNYQKVKLEPGLLLPTIGANGTIFRTEFLKINLNSDYLFDIDIISQVINTSNKPLYFAKVKVGIIHTFCESSIKKFIRKQKRRLTDYYNFLPYRQYNWSANNKTGIAKFSIYTLLIVPSIFDSIRGYIKKPDPAWFFHPLACIISFFLYASITLRFLLGLNLSLNRLNWKQ